MMIGNKAKACVPVMDSIRARVLNWREWPGCAHTWEQIHRLCPDASFFLSRGWVECWLATYGEELNPDLVEFARGDQVVGFCLLVWRTQWMRGIPLRRVYLNCSGENEGESTCIDHNSLLGLPDCVELVEGALLKILQSRYWDELILPGMGGGFNISPAVRSLGSMETCESPSHYIDFCKLRDNSAEFDSVLDIKVRRKIRRSRRAYDQIGGACTLRIAETREEAVTMLRTLAGLHQARWTSRGYPGAFGSTKLVVFHEALVRRTFDEGSILLFEVQAGSEIIGVLYCFLDRGWIRFYQSGYNYNLCPGQRPGFLTLFMAISYCLEQPIFKGFDFLAGDAEYKRSLSTGSWPSKEIVIHRPTVPSLLFRGLRSVKRAYVQTLKKSRGKNQSPRGPEHSADVSVPDFEASRVESDLAR
jgi:hypothetical protein